MKPLLAHEVCTVNGAGDVADAAQGGAAFGGALGVGYAISQGATGTAVAGFGAIGALAGAGLAGSFAGGYAVGNLLNEYTPVQSWISSGIELVQGWFGGGGSSVSDGFVALSVW